MYNNPQASCKEEAKTNFTALSEFICDLLGNTGMEVQKKYPQLGAIVSRKISPQLKCFDFCVNETYALFVLFNDICSKCYLFPVDDCYLDLYCQICNEMFESRIKYRWKSGDIHIQLIGHKENTCFYFYK